jgi:regulator of replication initiation timing
MTLLERKMSEQQAVHLVRNALLVAGQEMGLDGDHWPVIKSTVHSIMQDYENLQVERNVDAELKTHLYAQLAEMEKIAATCPENEKAAVQSKLKELREIYDAYFMSCDENYSESELPAYIQRTKAIIETLGDEDA